MTLFFWGHRPEADGSIGPGCLSQWWPCSFSIGGQRFSSAEQYMMWRKAVEFGDEGAASAILASGDPQVAKNLGRTVRGFSASRWAEVRLEVVVAGNVAKFGQNPPLERYLLGTGDRLLVEASPVDAVWGIGLSAAEARVVPPSEWPGLNLLGVALGRVRAILRDEPGAWS